jgi:hypothetical protein
VIRRRAVDRCIGQSYAALGAWDWRALQGTSLVTIESRVRPAAFETLRLPLQAAQQLNNLSHAVRCALSRRVKSVFPIHPICS